MKKNKTEEFFEKMLEFLPSTEEEYKKSIKHYNSLLETIVIEDIFMPEIIQLIKFEKDVKLLKNIFAYFEEVSGCKDEHLLNIFFITVLEILGNDRNTLRIAQKYMGRKTKKMQVQADLNLGRRTE